MSSPPNHRRISLLIYPLALVLTLLLLRSLSMSNSVPRPLESIGKFQSDTLLDHVYHTWDRISNQGSVSVSASHSAVQTDVPFLSHHLSLRKPINEFPRTRVVSHSPGFTVFQNLYVSNGTMFILSDNSTGDIPSELHWISFGGESEGRHVADGSLVVLDPDDEEGVMKHLERSAGVVKGVSFIWKDTYLPHYAHFMESLVGSWKIYTTSATGQAPDRAFELPFPERLIFTLVNAEQYRDYPRMNSFMLKTAFPGLSLQYERDWNEQRDYRITQLFETVVFLDRSATHGALPNARSNKINAGVALLESGRLWFEPFRRSVLMSVGVVLDDQGRALVRSSEEDVSGGSDSDDSRRRRRPVITYINRQGTGRRLKEEDHVKLVESLERLAETDDLVFRDVRFEEFGPAEQIRIASETDILIGVHGNGLTHLYFAQPSASAIEIVFPGGWSRDFELPSVMIGHEHFAIWNDWVVTQKDVGPGMQVPEGFHGTQIPVNAGTVVELVRSIVARKWKV